MRIGGANDDGPGTADATHVADQWQTTALRRLIHEEKGAVVLSFSHGCREGLCQIFGNNNLLRVHLSMLMVARLLLMLQRYDFFS